MTFSIGHIVVTRNSDTHKRVCDVLGQQLKLEWYDELGRQVENVSDLHCKFKSDEPTKQWLESKALWEAARKKHHEEVAAKAKRVSNPNKKGSGYIGLNHGSPRGK